MARRFVFVLAVVVFLASSSCLAADELLVPLPATAAPALTFGEGYTQLFGDSNLRLHGDGRRVHISLDERTGSGFASQAAHLHGFFGASIKLPSDHTAGVVVAFYMSNGDVYEKTHDELDFEFLGNVRGREWRVQTNVYGDGSTAVGREERYGLWFDPTEDFHRYAIRWTNRTIVFYIDDTPIREVVRSERMGAQFPSKPMSLYHHLGRLQLGYLRRPLQGGLQVCALRRPVHRPPAPAGAAPRRRRDHVAGAAGSHGEGPREVHDVRVLLRPRTVPGTAAGVQRGRGGGDVPPVGRGAVVGPAQARQAPPPCRRGLRPLTI